MQSTVNGSSIQTIIEMDKKAREKVANAKREAEEINSEAEGKKKQMLSDYLEHSKKRLETVEQSYRREADEKISQIDAEKDKKISDFDKMLNENRNSMMNSIFEAVTGCKRRA